MGTRWVFQVERFRGNVPGTRSAVPLDDVAQEANPYGTMALIRPIVGTSKIPDVGKNVPVKPRPVSILADNESTWSNRHRRPVPLLCRSAHAG